MNHWMMLIHIQIILHLNIINLLLNLNYLNYWIQTPLQKVLKTWPVFESAGSLRSISKPSTSSTLSFSLSEINLIK